MTVCGSGFFITSFPLVAHNLSISFIWKACWVLVWLVALLQDDVLLRREQKAESQGYGYLFICSQLDCPPGWQDPQSFCPSCTCLRNQLVPHLSRKFGLCWQCGLQGCAWIISVHHHSSQHLGLGRLSWAVSPKGQLDCVLQMGPWRVQAPTATSVIP